MKSYLQKMRDCALALFTATLIAGTVVACNGSSDAGTSGVSQAAFNQLKAQVDDQADAIATLQKQVEALQSGSDTALKAKLSHLYVTIAAPNAQGVSRDTQSYGDSSGGVQTMAVADTCSGLGTLTGHPQSSDPRTSDKLAGVSCTGYLFTVKAAPSGGNSHLMPLTGLLYAQPDCVGPAYVATSDISALAKQGGVAFSLPDWMVNDWSDPTNYYYLPANPQATTIVPVSHSDPAEPDGDGCDALMSTQLQVYQAVRYDLNNPKAYETTTGVPAGLIPGPVGMGTIQ